MEAPRELQALESVCVAKGLEADFTIKPQSSYDRDRDELARLGKKQVLKVCGFH